MCASPTSAEANFHRRSTLFRRAALAKQRNGLGVGSVMGKAWESLGVAQRSAFEDFAGLFVVTGKFGAHGKICAALQQQPCDGKACIVKLCNCVKDRGLSSNAGHVQRSSCIDVSSAIQ